MSFKLKQDCRLKSFNFAISTNEFKSLKFRMNIYQVKNNQPDSLIISENIFVDLSDQTTGWQFVDLEPYNIFLSDDLDEILVSIQWIESVKATNESKFFSIPASKSPLHKIYYRDKGMDKWKSQSGNLSMYLDAKCAI